MKNQTLIMGALTVVSVCAPMLGFPGVVIGTGTSAILIMMIFHYGFQGFNQPHIHYHYNAPAEQKTGYTEGHERKALLPNGAQYQERIVRRYDQ